MKPEAIQEQSGLPKISVITPCFNSIHTVRETLESVARQEYPNLEHIVIDGGSTDGTLEVVKSFAHVNWISEKDEGHYHAMNKGILRTGGEIINILNADDCYTPGALSKVGEAFRNHPEWDGLFGDVQYVDGSSKEFFRRREAVYDYNVLRFSGVCYIIHQALFVRRRVHDRLGLYRHKEFRNCCDFDFILNLGRARCHIGHLPEFLIRYRYHEHGQSADLRVTSNMAIESRKLLKEHGRPDGVLGECLRTLMRLKRQAQKLIYRGRCDLVPGSWVFRRHMRKKASFSSNIGLDRLPPVETS